MLNLDEKICSKCKIPKEKKEFGLASSKKSGLHSHCSPCKKADRAKKRKDDPEGTKKRDFANDLKKNYGITPQEYDTLYAEQNGRCACCQIHESAFKRGLHVDHDHNSGQVRGLLCTRCNPGIGYFEDSIEKLEMAIAYLRKSKKLG